jgi:hypothetical protein
MPSNRLQAGILQVLNIIEQIALPGLICINAAGSTFRCARARYAQPNSYFLMMRPLEIPQSI